MAPRASRYTPIRWSRNRGRNGGDVSTNVPDDMSVESFNVILKQNGLGTKRGGITSNTISGDAFAGAYQLYTFVPAAGDASVVVFVVSTDGTTKILTVTSGAATNLTIGDAVSNAQETQFATLNGKCYIAYNSSVNRLHVYNTAKSSTAIQRVGMAPPAAPSIANTGAGTYAATLRYYRIQWRYKSGSTILTQSNLGASQSFTPSGTGTHARVTKPSASGEGETHWVIYGSADDISFYELSEVVVGTTTYDDNEAPDDYDVNDPAPDEGAFTPWPSVKFLLSTGERLLGFGVWETAQGDSLVPRAGRVYFSPVLDASDTDDDERVSNTLDFQGWIDVSRSAGGEDRALAGPIDGSILVMQSRGIYLLTPTGNATTPYTRTVLSTTIGCVSQASTFMGEDEHGRACVYWLDPRRGPYRYGSDGLQWLGYDLADVIEPQIIVLGGIAAASGCYDPILRACVFGLSTSFSTTYVFFAREGRPTPDGVRYGWVKWTFANPTTCYTIRMLPNGTNAAYPRLYVGTSTASNIFRVNTTALTDNSTNFEAYVTSRVFDFGADWRTNHRVGEAYIQAKTIVVATVYQLLFPNFVTAATVTSSRSVLATGVTRLVRKFEDAKLADVQTIQVTLGDSGAANQTWELDDYQLLVEPSEVT
jgi:hypothetical protein